MRFKEGDRAKIVSKDSPFVGEAGVVSDPHIAVYQHREYNEYLFEFNRKVFSHDYMLSANGKQCIIVEENQIARSY